MTGNPAISGADMKKRIVYIMTLRLGYELSLSRKLLLASAGLAVVGGSLLLDRTRSTDGKKVDRRDVALLRRDDRRETRSRLAAEARRHA